MAPLPEHMKTRIRAIRWHMKERDAHGVLVTGITNVRYLSGFTGTEAALLIKNRAKYILTDSRYITQAGVEAQGYKVLKISRKDRDVAAAVADKGVERLLYEPEGMTHARFLELRKNMEGVRLIKLGDAIQRLRSCKDPIEARMIKKAADIASKALREVLPRVRPGWRETELAVALETAMRKAGSERLPFDTIVASGKRGALPHGVATNKRIKKGELLTIDFGATWKGYQSDQTVTVCMGKPGKKQEHIYNTVLRAQAAAMESIEPGSECARVDAAARGHIKEKGYGECFGHGLGHGVGLETHEGPVLAPRSKDTLEEGNVVTVEPGIYVPGWGGVRIEDMVLVTAKGRRVLTGSRGTLKQL